MSKERKKADNLFTQRLATRLVVLDKLEKAAKDLEKAEQSDAYKEGVQLVLQLISNQRDIYKSATSVTSLQLIAPSDNSDVYSFVTAIDGMMSAIKDLSR